MTPDDGIGLGTHWSLKIAATQCCWKAECTKLFSPMENLVVDLNEPNLGASTVMRHGITPDLVITQATPCNFEFYNCNRIVVVISSRTVLVL